MKIKFVESPIERSQICNHILRALPEWFGIESAIDDYCYDVQSMQTWAVEEGDHTIGFISINKHNIYAAEVHVMGVLKEYHGVGLGRHLLLVVEKELQQEGFQFLTVKTLSESRPSPEYDKTRQFYLKSGFVPIEEFKTLWGEHNPCLFLIKSIGQASKISHIEINVSRYFECVQFYEKFLLILGWKKLVSQKSHTTFTDGQTKLVLCPTEEKYIQDGFHRKRTGLNHLAFYAKTKSQVDSFFSQIMTEMNLKALYDGKPSGDDSYYSVFFEDPDRMKIEVVYAPTYCHPLDWTNTLENDNLNSEVGKN